MMGDLLDHAENFIIVDFSGCNKKSTIISRGGHPDHPNDYGAGIDGGRLHALPANTMIGECD
jgi:hypothetical protein